MGYACPVCGDPQADAEHLANHLAFTAMLRDDDHAAWLDDHAPGWDDEGAAELADRVADEAEEVEFPRVFEDTTGTDRAPTEGRHEHDHHGRPATDAPRRGPRPDGEAGRILSEARELTREMLDADGDGADDSDGAGRDETE